VKVSVRSYFLAATICSIPRIFPASKLAAQDAHFHNAPTSSNQLKNPYVAYDHAFCTKLCAAAGSPLLFISDRGGQVYLVLTERNGVRLPEEVLDRIGVPGVVVKGKAFEADGLRALAVEGFAQ